MPKHESRWNPWNVVANKDFILRIGAGENRVADYQYYLASVLNSYTFRAGSWYRACGLKKQLLIHEMADDDLASLFLGRDVVTMPAADFGSFDCPHVLYLPGCGGVFNPLPLNPQDSTV